MWTAYNIKKKSKTPLKRFFGFTLAYFMAKIKLK